MLRKLILALSAAFALAALPASAHAQLPPDAVQWRAEGLRAVAANSRFLLVNERAGSPLGYENRTFGVDLGWRAGGGDFELRPKSTPHVRDHRRRAIAPTERMALYNTRTKRYLIYQQRGSSKAELAWSKDRVHEWEIHGQWGARFALFNARVDRYLVHQHKTFGINLGWAEDPPLTAAMPLAAQPMLAGYVPFTGTFGEGVNGRVLGIRNESAVNTLRVVKYGGSDRDCASVDGTVLVRPTATLTSAQLQAVFRSTTPRLPLKVLACVAGTEPRVALTYLQLTYRLAR